MSYPTLEEVISQTRERVGSDVDLSYITAELVDADARRSVDPANQAVQAGALAGDTLWGNNGRYGIVVVDGQNYQCYYFDQGGAMNNRNTACGSGYTYHAAMAWGWHHQMQGHCPNGRELWSFIQG